MTRDESDSTDALSSARRGTTLSSTATAAAAAGAVPAKKKRGALGNTKKTCFSTQGIKLKTGFHDVPHDAAWVPNKRHGFRDCSSYAPPPGESVSPGSSAPP